MQTLEMLFATSVGTTFRMSVPNPIVPIDQQQVNQVMDLIVAKKVFDTGAGELVNKKAIRLVDHTVSEIPL
jgi:hypothetical protein